MFNLNILGITLYDLIFELQNGIRLPDPENCPSSMVTLIRKCFHHIPSERPTFNEVKKVVELDYAQLRRSNDNTYDE